MAAAVCISGAVLACNVAAGLAMGLRTGFNKTCPCGTEFYCKKSTARKQKYCSQTCKYKYRVRPRGLVYDVKVVNRSWIRPGERLSESTEFKKGVTSHNFKAEGVGYCALHDWVKRHAGKATVCEFCSSTVNVQWANKSWEYKRDLSDWLSLCFRCHRTYDRQGGWGKASQKFPEIRR